jgi:hypothetical protein
MTRVDEPASTPHLSGYARRDHEVVDYGMCALPGTALQVRGPLPPTLEAGSFVVCLGAAQTFGCFAAEPFPALLGARLGVPVLNLGYGGAGASFFLTQPGVLALVNRARAAVVQVLSARSESNARFETGGLEFLRRRADGVRLGAAAAWQAELDGADLLPGLRARWARWGARRIGRWRARGLAAETRRNWVASTRRLADEIRVPKVLLWFSRRPPRYEPRYQSVATLFGEFPHLVDEEMIRAVRPRYDRYVECVTSAGSPQLLRSRFTGEPCTVDPGRDRADLGGESWTHNRYYPAPEAHVEVTGALEPVLRELLDLRSTERERQPGAPPRA